MSWKTWMPGRALGALLALGAMAAAVPAHPADAQVVRVRPPAQAGREDCRCVDRDGKPIERCTCVVTPDVDRIVTLALSDIRGRARLGISLASGLEESPDGARVTGVLEDGPAAAAGIREGDVITKLDGKSLLQPLGPDIEEDLDEDASLPVQRLMALVREIEPGQEVSVEFLRDGERRTVTVAARALNDWSFSFSGPAGEQAVVLRERMEELRARLGEMRLRAPDSDRVRILSDSARSLLLHVPEAPQAGWLYRGERDGGVLRACPGAGSGDWGVFAVPGGCMGGLQLVELNPGLADYFGTSEGVLVADVHEDSKLGIRPGDVVLSVGDRQATDPDRLRRILGSYGADEEVTLRIVRQKREMSVTGTLGR